MRSNGFFVLTGAADLETTIGEDPAPYPELDEFKDVAAGAATPSVDQESSSTLNVPLDTSMLLHMRESCGDYGEKVCVRHWVDPTKLLFFVVDPTHQMKTMRNSLHSSSGSCCTLSLIGSVSL